MDTDESYDSYSCSPKVLYFSPLRIPIDISLDPGSFLQCRIHENICLLYKDLPNEEEAKERCHNIDQLHKKIFVLLGFNEGPYPPPDLSIYQICKLVNCNNKIGDAHTRYYMEVISFSRMVLNLEICCYKFFRGKIDQKLMEIFFLCLTLVKNSTVPQTILLLFHICQYSYLEDLDLFLMFEFDTSIQLISPDLSSKEYFGHLFFDATNSSIRFCGSTFHVSLPFELQLMQAIYRTSTGNISLDIVKNEKSKTSNGHIVTLTKEDGTTEKYYEKDLYCSATNNHRSDVIKSRKLCFIDMSLKGHIVPSTLLSQQSGDVHGNNYFGLLLEYLSRGTNVSFDYYKSNYKDKIHKKHIKSISNLPSEEVERILDDFEEIFCQYDFVKHVNETHELFSYIMLKNIGFIPTFQCYKSMLDHRIKVIIKDVQSVGIVMGSDFTFPDAASVANFPNFLSIISHFELTILKYLFRIDDFHRGNLAYVIKQYQSIQYIESIKVIDLWPSYDILPTFELYPVVSRTSDPIINQYLQSNNFEDEIQGIEFPDLNIKGINNDFSFILKSPEQTLKQFFLVFISFSRVITKIYNFVLESTKTDELNGRGYQVKRQTEKVLTQFIDLSKRDLDICKNLTLTAENNEQIDFLRNKSLLASRLLICDLHQKLFVTHHEQLFCMDLFLFKKINIGNQNENSLIFSRCFDFQKLKQDFESVSLFLLTHNSYDSLFEEYASSQTTQIGVVFILKTMRDSICILCDELTSSF